MTEPTEWTTYPGTGDQQGRWMWVCGMKLPHRGAGGREVDCVHNGAAGTRRAADRMAQDHVRNVHDVSW